MNVVKYPIEDNNNQIYISVNIITNDAALVTADVNLLINDKRHLIGKSENGEHFIPKSSIGIANELANGLLVIDAVIDLRLVDKELWENCFKNLSIKYILEGGKEKKSYQLLPEDYKYKSDTGEKIVTKKFIRLRQV
ncbi:hypothetical protein [Flavobacterium sp. N1736]|uniref:hypothetical protein n=1 Tax=Flavobacterium sp. N1736 TaxID=2986823 RepID=UPI0022246277|nr:hypothetical protein [Flavobacterium sp. N1736]